MRVLLFRFCPELPPEQTLFYTALYTDEESPRNRRARAPERSNTDTRTLGTRAFFIFSKEEEKIKKGFWTLERGQLGNQARFFERTTMEGAAGASLSRAPSASFRSTVAPEKTVRVLREVDDIQSWRNGGVAKADVGKSGLLQFTATASSHCPGSAPFNLVDANDARIGYNASGAFGARRMKDRAAREGTKTEGWVTAARSDAWLLIELTRKSVVNEIILLNHATSRLTVSIALRARESAFVDIRTDILLAHKKESRIACGSLPCKYIKLRCHRGAPISIASIKFLGLPVGNANAKGDQFDKLRARSAQQVRVALPALPSLSLARRRARAPGCRFFGHERSPRCHLTLRPHFPSHAVAFRSAARVRSQHTEDVIYGPSLRATRATFLSPHSDLSFRASPARTARAAAVAAAADDDADAPRDYDAEIEALASRLSMPPEPPLSRSVDSFAAPAQLGRTFASAGPGGAAGGEFIYVPLHSLQILLTI